MQVKIVPGYEGGISTGQRQRWVFYGTGPAIYSTSTFDPILLPNGIYIDSIKPCMDTTHTYIAFPFPSAVGTTRATWTFRWFTAASMAEVTNSSTALAAIVVQFEVCGGEF